MLTSSFLYYIPLLFSETRRKFAIFKNIFIRWRFLVCFFFNFTFSGNNNRIPWQNFSIPFLFFFFLIQIYTISCTIFRTIIQDFEICKFTKFPEDFKHFVKSNRGKNWMEETMSRKNRHSTDLERLKSFTNIQSI